MSTVIYVAVVEGDQNGGYSAFFPDLPGCVTAAETMLELPAAARDALSLHLQGMIEDGDTIPEPTPLEAIKADPEVKEVGRVLVDAEVEDPLVRVNISIGQQFLKRLDVAAEARGMTRSAFLIEAARVAMAPGTSNDGKQETASYLAATGQDDPWDLTTDPVCRALTVLSSNDVALNAVMIAAGAHLGGAEQLGAHMCKWPIGDPMGTGFRFCGRTATRGGVYCTAHAEHAAHRAADHAELRELPGWTMVGRKRG